MLLKPGPVLVSISSIVDDQILGLTCSEDRKVVDYSRAWIAEEGIVSLADFECGNVVCYEAVEKCLRVLALNRNSSHVRDVKQPCVRSYGFALGDYSLEPDRKLVISVVYNIAMFLMIIIDLRSLRHCRPCLGNSVLGRKGSLLRGRSCLGTDPQFLNHKTQLISTLGTVATVPLYALTRRF